MTQTPPTEIAAQDGHAPALRVMRYPGIDLVVALQGADDLPRALAQVVRGWHPQTATDLAPDARVSSVLHTPEGYVTRSSYLDTTLHGLGIAGASCTVIADLVQDYFETRAGYLALHCAGFRYNNRMIAVTGQARAGKSTLAARLTQEPDIAVFCDDVLPLGPDGTAVGLGVAPRLRLPLPATSTPAFRAHVARHLGPCDERYGYVCAPTVAPHGSTAPLDTLLILDRQPAGPAGLHAVADDTAIRHLLSRNMADLDDAGAAFGRMTELLAGITCLRLVYADLEDAVALIRQAFGVPAGVCPSLPIGSADADPSPRDGTAPGRPADLPLDQIWARAPDVEMHHKAKGAFLWHDRAQIIWHMNLLGVAIWVLLELPGSAHDIAQVLSEQFPDQPPAVLLADVAALLGSLADDGLIIPA